MNETGLITKAIRMVGLKVRDKVTGFEGVIDSISFDLYGCVTGCVRPQVSKDKPSEIPQGCWFDIKRLEGDERIMPVPSFEGTQFGKENGAAEKPVP